MQYVAALEAAGVITVMGKFKTKDKKCPMCSQKWIGHEEKESDVNVALYLLNLAYRNAYDHALLVSNDSDLAPAIRMVLSNFPHKKITTVVPPRYFQSNELLQASSGKAKILVEQLERSLFPQTIYDAQGRVVVNRPVEYSPPNIHSIALP